MPFLIKTYAKPQDTEERWVIWVWLWPESSWILERSSVSNTSRSELNLFEVTHNSPPTEVLTTSFRRRPMGALGGGGAVWMRSATSWAPMVYLWFLIVTAGIPLVALCIQSDGGPHTTGGTEPEYEPWRIRENDPQALKPRTSQMARWAREHAGSDNQCMLQKSE